MEAFQFANCLRKIGYRSVEYVLLYAGIGVAQELSDSFLLLIMQTFLPCAFVLSAATLVAKKLDAKPIALVIIATVVGCGAALGVVEAGREAARAALLQISSPKADAQIRRRQIRRTMMGGRMDCADETAFYSPSCHAFFKREEASENAVR